MKLVEAGKVRWVGVSNFDAILLDRCEAIRHVDSLQPPFSLVNRAAAEKEIPWCASHDTGVICYSPMQSGLLTENFMAERVAALAEDDWRRRAFDGGDIDVVVDQAAHQRIARIGGAAAEHHRDEVTIVALDRGDDIEAGIMDVTGLDAVDAGNAAEQVIVVAHLLAAELESPRGEVVVILRKAVVDGYRDLARKGVRRSR